MAHSTTLLNDVLSFLGVFSKFILSEEEKKEILVSVNKAAQLTEDFFYKKGNRKIERNTEIAKAWIEAGLLIQQKLPSEPLGIWLQNKGEAYLNPKLWSEEELSQNNLEIEQIKKRIREINSTFIKLKK
jgi:hypothetical protein